MDYSNVTADQWQSMTCYGYRASTDNSLYVKNVAVGNEIVYRGGFALWMNSTTTETLASGSSSQRKFTITEDLSAGLTTASTAFAAALIALVSF